MANTTNISDHNFTTFDAGSYFLMGVVMAVILLITAYIYQMKIKEFLKRIGIIKSSRYSESKYLHSQSKTSIKNEEDRLTPNSKESNEIEKLEEIENKIDQILSKIGKNSSSNSSINLLDKSFETKIADLENRVNELIKNNLSAKNKNLELNAQIKAYEERPASENKLKIDEEFKDFVNKNKDHDLFKKIFKVKERSETIQKNINANEQLFVNALISQGKRKNVQNDRELGEDNCGFLQLGDYLFTWVLDGESDGEPISIENEDLFSARIFTQDIGTYLPNSIMESDLNQIDLNKIALTAINEVVDHWQQKLEHYPEFSRSNVYYGTTIVISCYSKLTKELKVLRIGDSILFPFNKQDQLIDSLCSNLETPPKSTYIRIQSGHVRATFEKNTDSLITESIAGVKTFFLFSDGLSKRAKELMEVNLNGDLNELLPQFMKKDYKNPDDKAMVFVQLRED